MINEMKFNEDVALMCGLKEAVLASYLWDLISRDDDVIYRYEKLWTRISQRSLSVHLPFLSERAMSQTVLS